MRRGEYLNSVNRAPPLPAPTSTTASRRPNRSSFRTSSRSGPPESSYRLAISGLKPSSSTVTEARSNRRPNRRCFTSNEARRRSNPPLTGSVLCSRTRRTSRPRSTRHLGYTWPAEQGEGSRLATVSHVQTGEPTDSRPQPSPALRAGAGIRPHVGRWRCARHPARTSVSLDVLPAGVLRDLWSSGDPLRDPRHGLRSRRHPRLPSRGRRRRRGQLRLHHPGFEPGGLSRLGVRHVKGHLDPSLDVRAGRRAARPARSAARLSNDAIVGLPGEMDQYLSGLGTKTRQHVKNYRRRIENEHPRRGVRDDFRGRDRGVRYPAHHRPQPGPDGGQGSAQRDRRAVCSAARAAHAGVRPGRDGDRRRDDRRRGPTVLRRQRLLPPRDRARPRIQQVQSRHALPDPRRRGSDRSWWGALASALGRERLQDPPGGSRHALCSRSCSTVTAGRCCGRSWARWSAGRRRERGWGQT